MSNHKKTKSYSLVKNYGLLLNSVKFGQPNLNLDIISKVFPRNKNDDELHIIKPAHEILNNNYFLVGSPNNQLSSQNKIETKYDEDKKIIIEDNSPHHFSNKNESDMELKHNPNEIVDTTREYFIANKPNNYSINHTQNSYKFVKTIMKEEEELPFEAELKFIEDFIKLETAVEDEHQTSNYFITIQIDELISCILAIIGMCSGILYWEIKTTFNNVYSEEFKNSLINIALDIVSISVLLFIISLVFKYVHYMNLYKSAHNIGINDNFFESGLMKSAILEVVLAIIHPNYLCHDLTFTTDENWNLKTVTYSVNDFLLLLFMSRLFYIFRTIIVLTKFYSDRADRVSKMMGNRLTMYFSFKCLLIKYPIQLLVLITSAAAFTLAFMIQIIESPVYYLELKEGQVNLNDYRRFENCIWNMFVTMTTVGYGDYFPLTVLGRLIIIISSISGIVLVSLVVIFLQNYTNLKENEEKVYDFITRLIDKDEIKKQAAIYFHHTFKYFLKKKEFLRLVRQDKNANQIDLDERRKNLLNALYQKLRGKKKFKGYLHHFQNTYGTPDDFETINKKIDDIESNLLGFSQRTFSLEGKLNKILSYIESIPINDRLTTMGTLD